jgi:hypothetical protein
MSSQNLNTGLLNAGLKGANATLSAANPGVLAVANASITTTSTVIATYSASGAQVARTLPLTVGLANGTATIQGDTSATFSYVIFP